MSETKNTHDSETVSDEPAYFSELFTDERLQYETIRFLIINFKIDPFDQKALSELLQRFKWQFNEDIVRQAVEDAQTKVIEDALNSLSNIPKLPRSAPKYEKFRTYDPILEQTSETKKIQYLIVTEMYREILSDLAETNPSDKQELISHIASYLIKQNDPILLHKIFEDRNAAVHGLPIKSESERSVELASEFKNFKVEIFSLSINVKPLTPQALALAFTALTELTTKLWLIARHRLADLIEYTQTRDVRFANEAGSTITYVTYNSPFSFGLQVDEVVPGIADAISNSPGPLGTCQRS